jgi:hypothetical protein
MKLKVAGAIAGIVAFTAATAFAADWTDAITIRTIEVNHNGDMYRVYTDSTISSGPSCQTDYYEIQANSAAVTKELIARTLLSAYLAGQKVKILTSTDVCSASGRRTIAGVRVSTNY